MGRGRVDYNAIDWSSLVYYDETSPTFLRWKIEIRSGRNNERINASPNEPAGTISPIGYGKLRSAVRYKRRWYYTHRVVWILHNGFIEDDLVIDHIDGDATNNNILNLRLVSRKINNRNRLKQVNKTGLTGVYLRFISGHYEYYAGWRDENGVLRCKYFSCDKYGEEQAKFLAKEYRNKMISERNNQGAGYTDKHINE